MTKPSFPCDIVRALVAYDKQLENYLNDLRNMELDERLELIEERELISQILALRGPLASVGSLRLPAAEDGPIAGLRIVPSALAERAITDVKEA